MEFGSTSKMKLNLLRNINGIPNVWIGFYALHERIVEFILSKFIGKINKKINKCGKSFDIPMGGQHILYNLVENAAAFGVGVGVETFGWVSCTSLILSNWQIEMFGKHLKYVNPK